MLKLTLLLMKMFQEQTLWFRKVPRYWHQYYNDAVFATPLNILMLCEFKSICTLWCSEQLKDELKNSHKFTVLVQILVFLKYHQNTICSCSVKKTAQSRCFHWKMYRTWSHNWDVWANWDAWANNKNNHIVYNTNEV